MTTDPSTIRERIARIDAILASGTTSSSLDGVTITWNHEQLRRERAALEKQLPGSAKKQRRSIFNCRFF